MPEIQKHLQTLGALRQASRNEHRYFVFEINRDCNRACSHCGVQALYDKNAEFSLEKKSYQVINKLKMD